MARVDIAPAAPGILYYSGRSGNPLFAVPCEDVRATLRRHNSSVGLAYLQGVWFAFEVWRDADARGKRWDWVLEREQPEFQRRRPVAA